MKIRKRWNTPFGIVETPNLFVEKTTDTLIWNKLGFDLDYSNFNMETPVIDVDENPQNGHKHVFVNLKETPSFDTIQKMIIERGSKPLYSTISSMLLSSPTSKYSLLYDAIINDVHKALANNFNADKATASHINHAFRTAYTKDKPYIRIKHATKRTTPFIILSHMSDKKLLFKKIIAKYIEKAAKFRLIPTFFSEDRFYKRSYKRPNFVVRADIAEIIRHVVSKYWIKGHRQNLALRLAGVAYRYITKDINKLKQLFDLIIPLDDEERSKRFDPLKTIHQKKTIYGLTGLEKYIQENIDKKFSIRKFRKALETTDTTTSLVPFVNKHLRKRHTQFEIQQALMILFINYCLVYRDVNNEEEIDFYVPSLEFLRNKLKEFTWSFDQKYVFQNHVIKKALQALNESGLIECYSLGRKWKIIIKHDIVYKLYHLITYDINRGQFILWNLQKIMNSKCQEWPDDVIEDRKKDFMRQALQLAWTFVFYDSIYHPDMESLLKETFRIFHKQLLHKIPDTLKLSERIFMLIYSISKQQWNDVYKILNSFNLTRFVSPLETSKDKRRFLIRFYYESLEGLKELVRILYGLIQKSLHYSKP